MIPIVPLMLPDAHIDHDMPCDRCRYNLRGLTVRRRCPECGLPAVVSFVRFAPTIPWGDDLYVLVAGDADRTIDGILFVRDCLRLALTNAAKVDGKPVPIGAVEACEAVRAYARAYFNDEAEALALLEAWGVRCSEDVGRIVFAMVRRGLIRARPQDSLADFRGIFTLETLFAPGPEL